MKIREPVYIETAHITIDTSRRGPRAVVAEILQHLTGQPDAGAES